MWEFAELLPVSAHEAVDLGEGWTPLLGAPRLGAAVGLPKLFLKNESTNPTWSHKDRLCAVATAAVRSLGATATTAASTGNHGASVAAYAARAGMPSVIFTLTSVPETMRILIRSYGSAVIAAKDVPTRNALMRHAMDQYGLLPISNASSPAIGSNPFGIEGYKTIAYELWLQLENRSPDWVIVPTAYGDCLAGIARGFDDLRALGLIDRVPKLVVAEPYGAVGAALNAATTGAAVPVMPAEPTVAFSIASNRATDQSVRALQASNGLASTTRDESLLIAQSMIGALEGLFVEPSSAAALVAAQSLFGSGVISADDTVVLLMTSTGLKDTASAASLQGGVAVLDSAAGIEGALRAQLDDSVLERLL